MITGPMVLSKLALIFVHAFLALIHSGERYAPSFYLLLLTVSACCDVIVAPIICLWGIDGGYPDEEDV